MAQAAFYTLGEFGEMRDTVIATMDTGGRTWDWERIPADRLETALAGRLRMARRAGELTTSQNGPDPDALPDRDFSASSLAVPLLPLPGHLPAGDGRRRTRTDEETETEGKEVTDEEARDAVAAYAEAQDSIREPEKAKRAALDTLKAWMRRQGDTKATVNGRTVSLVQTTRYSVDHRKLNEALDPETRAGIVTESESEYVRVS